LRNGARALLAQAVEAEVAVLLKRHAKIARAQLEFLNRFTGWTRSRVWQVQGQEVCRV